MTNLRSHLAAMDGLVDKTRGAHAQGRILVGEWSFVTGPDGALSIMRELRHALGDKRLSYDDDPDSLILFRGLPVRIRVEHTGRTSLLPNASVEPRGCCDATAFQVIMMACAAGRA